MFHNIVTKLALLIPKSLVNTIAQRFIGGETANDALTLGIQLYEQGYTSTFDILGEDVSSFAEARKAVDEYIELIDKISKTDMERNISLKLTRFGLRLEQNKAFEEFKRVLEKAAEKDFFVRIDMEDSSVTDLTLDFYKRAMQIWPRVGTVFQARLKRTRQDALELSKIPGANIRLCKGIYPESGKIAYTNVNEMRDSYVKTLNLLLNNGAYVGLATHDRVLINKVKKEIEENHWKKTRYEFQALLGVPAKEHLEALRNEGNKVRIYIPFGSDWFAYSMRRLKESPQLAGRIALTLLKPRGR